MQLEEYFDFLAPNDIRLKGTRVGIETILYDFIFRSRTPEEIQRSYPSLTLEQVYATITYYLHRKDEVTRYLEEWIEHGERMLREQWANPTPAMKRLRRLRQLEDAKRRLELEVELGLLERDQVSPG